MALNFKQKIKKDMLNAWKDSGTIYVCAMKYDDGHQPPPAKIDCKAVPFPTTNNNKLTYNTKIDLSIPEGTYVHHIVLTTDTTDNAAIANNLIATEEVDETFQYGGTYRINQIDIELTWKKT